MMQIIKKSTEFDLTVISITCTDKNLMINDCMKGIQLDTPAEIWYNNEAITLHEGGAGMSKFSSGRTDFSDFKKPLGMKMVRTALGEKGGSHPVKR